VQGTHGGALRAESIGRAPRPQTFSDERTPRPSRVL
jgi:hypothetical protein